MSDQVWPALNAGNDAQSVFPTGGLTKRELFAAMALQAIVSRGGAIQRPARDEIAKIAIDYADDLIAELKKEPAA